MSTEVIGVTTTAGTTNTRTSSHRQTWKKSKSEIETTEEQSSAIVTDTETSLLSKEIQLLRENNNNNNIVINHHHHHQHPFLTTNLSTSSSASSTTSEFSTESIISTTNTEITLENHNNHSHSNHANDDDDYEIDDENENLTNHNQHHHNLLNDYNENLIELNRSDDDDDDNSNNDDDDNEIIINNNNFSGHNHHMSAATTTLPSTIILNQSPISTSSLPPLPGLIPIRKANQQQIDHHSIMAPLAMKKSSATSSPIKNGIATTKLVKIPINNKCNNSININIQNILSSQQNDNKSVSPKLSILCNSDQHSGTIESNLAQQQQQNQDNYKQKEELIDKNLKNEDDNDDDDDEIDIKNSSNSQSFNYHHHHNDNLSSLPTTIIHNPILNSSREDNTFLDNQMTFIPSALSPSIRTISQEQEQHDIKPKIADSKEIDEIKKSETDNKPKRGRKIKIKTEIIDNDGNNNNNNDTVANDAGGGSNNDGDKVKATSNKNNNAEIITHRKSDRRRVARDIFFLIEEYPINRRRKNGKTINGKGKKPRGRPKSKFSHLRASNSTSILRHQSDDESRTNTLASSAKKQLPPAAAATATTTTTDKLKSNSTVTATIERTASPAQSEIKSKAKLPPISPVPKLSQNELNDTKISQTKSAKPITTTTVTTPSSIIATSVVTGATSEKVPENQSQSTENKTVNASPAPARVNPIFLWVKQDDTRIVEVRCEDYDKRNRIRLTKTPNGWKAIPRTDPTSSRCAKLLPNPVLKIKQERRENLDLLAFSSSTTSKDSSGENSGIEANEYCALMKRTKNKKKKKKKKKKKHKQQQEVDDENISEEQQQFKERLVLKIPNLSMESIEKLSQSSSASEHQETLNAQILLSSKTGSQTDGKSDNTVYESLKRRQNNLNEELLQQQQSIMLESTTTTTAQQSKEENDVVAQNIVSEHNPTTNHENINLPIVNTTTKNSQSNGIEEITAADDEEDDDDDDDDDVDTHEIDEANIDLTKNLTELSDDDIEMQIPQFMVHHASDKEYPEQLMSLCPTSNQNNANSAGNFDNDNNQQQKVNISVKQNEQQQSQNVVLPETFDSTDGDTKNLKDLLDDADLLQHCDNAMCGTELIDSLVKQGCEENNINDDDVNQNTNNQVNNDVDDKISANNDNPSTICLTDDFENEEDDMMMQQEPVEDIISRLNDSLTASPKCLSFNEAGDIEGLHGELFQANTLSDPFNRTQLEELSITIKDLEKSTEDFIKQPLQQEKQNKQTLKSTKQNSVERSTTIVSPDSCADELPKDLTCKKTNESNDASSTVATNKNSTSEIIEIDRPNSRSSDAIQSPQPSGLPAVAPSPDLLHSKNKSIFLDQLLNATSSTSPKICSSLTVTPIKIPKNNLQQKEPLDLGKHRKSASPTVSCSEEVNRSKSLKSSSVVTIEIDGNGDEPAAKRIKRETNIAQNQQQQQQQLKQQQQQQQQQNKSHTENLMEMLSSGKDPDPLMQLRLLISNPEWKVPDPILVPKDRLNAVLASPAREIPLLLTTRPELRLPEAFGYPSILQDPDILVISMAQLESILQKQIEVTPVKPMKAPPILPQVTIEAVCSKNRNQKSSTPSSLVSPSPPPPPSEPQLSPKITQANNSTNAKNLINPLAPLLATGLAGDIDSATMAAFNQMLWLPYLGQMAPELFKAMAAMQNGGNNTNNNNNINNLAELIPLLAAQQQAQQTQQQNQQRSQLAAVAAAAAAAATTGNNSSGFNPAAAVAAAAALQNPMAFQNPLEIAMWQQALTQAQMQRAMNLQKQQQAVAAAAAAAAAAAQREQAKKNENKLNAQRNLAALFAAQKNAEFLQQQQQQQQQHQLQQKAQQAQKSRSSLIGINPFRQELNPNRAQQQRNTSNSSTTTASSSNDKTNPKTNRSLNPFHQNYAHGGVDITPVLRKTKPNTNNCNPEQKPRVTCKSLTNLLQPNRYQNSSSINDMKISNLMASLPGFDFNLASATNPFQLPAPNNQQQQQQSQNNFHGQFPQQHQHQQQQQHNNRNTNHNQQQRQQQLNSSINKNNQHGKLKVKSGSHLLDPAAVQRRLLNCNSNGGGNLPTNSGINSGGSNGNNDDIAEVGSTTSSLDEMMMTDPNAALWHPLFGSAQKSAYNSPWQWTTVTATGE